MQPSRRVFFGLILTISHTDVILQDVIGHARPILQPYQDGASGPPDPSFVLQLSNEILSGSNLYAVQKTFDGTFQFDVFYESASAGHKLDGGPEPVNLNPMTINVLC
jgi:hypothetical protein